MVTKLDIDDLPKNAANYTALTPLWFLQRAAQVHPTRKSVIHGSRQYTWHQTYQRCRRFASALSKLSIGPGNTVTTFFYFLFFFIFLIANLTLTLCLFAILVLTLVNCYQLKGADG